MMTAARSNGGRRFPPRRSCGGQAVVAWIVVGSTAVVAPIPALGAGATGSVERIERKLPASKPDPQVSALGKTMLQAIQKGDQKAFQQSLAHNPPPDHADSAGRTGLMWGATLGRTEMTAILHGRGADPNIKDKRMPMATPLSFLP